MAASHNKRRRTLRDYLRMLFGNKVRLALCTIAGVLIAILINTLQERTYLGRMELASSSVLNPTRGRIPDSITLRRLVLGRGVLRELLPADYAGDVDAAIHRLQESIELVPAVEKSTAEGEVWRWTAEIPAQSNSLAVEQLQRYLQKMQAAFSGQIASKVAPAAGLVQIEQEFETEFQFVGLFEPVEEVKQPAPQPTEPDGYFQRAEKALVQQAQPLGVNSLDELPAAIDSAERAVDEQRKHLDRLNQDLDRQKRLLSLAESPEMPTVLPEDIRAEHPDFTASGEKLMELRRQRAAYVARMKPAHPQVKAIDQNIAEATRWHQEKLNELLDGYEASIPKLTEEVGKARQKLVEQEARRSKLMDLRQRHDRLVQESDRQQDQRQLAEHLRTMLPATGSTAAAPQTIVIREPERTAYTPTPSVPSTTPRPGELVVRDGEILVSGPFVDSSPIRPREGRNLLLGAMFGFIGGFLFVMVLAGLDQRVHLPTDMVDLGVQAEVLGSIPQLSRGTPVRLFTAAGSG